jgi:hypothetical protein
MDSYKIIFPYQSDITHIASNDIMAFDLCFDELKKMRNGNFPDVFVVLNTNTNIPFYLEVDKKLLQDNKVDQPNPIDDEITVNKDIRNSSDTLDMTPPIFNNPMKRPFDNIGNNENIQINENIKPADLVQSHALDNPTNQNLENRIRYLETELVKMKMKVDYVTQLNIGHMHTNMNDQRMGTGISPNHTPNKTPDEDACTIM